MKTMLCALLALGMSGLAGETITTLPGEKFEGATVGAVNPACVKITHDGGVATVRFTELPADVQKKYGYDAEKEKAWRAEMQKAQRMAIIAEHERKKAEQVQSEKSAAAVAALLDEMRAGGERVYDPDTRQFRVRYPGDPFREDAMKAALKAKFDAGR